VAKALNSIFPLIRLKNKNLLMSASTRGDSRRTARPPVSTRRAGVNVIRLFLCRWRCGKISQGSLGPNICRCGQELRGLSTCSGITLKLGRIVRDVSVITLKTGNQPTSTSSNSSSSRRRRKIATTGSRLGSLTTPKW
jgi:hypothetical protein